MRKYRSQPWYRLSWLVSLALSFAWVAPADTRVVVISPHNEAIRSEFGRGFAEWYLKKYGEPARVEWRDLGGSTDALRFVQSEFAKKPDGIGLDCFFGGGLEPFLRLIAQNLCQAYHPPAEIMAGIPQNFNGVDVYDKNFRWFGAALSSFGILQSLRVEKLMALPLIERWDELDRPDLFGWVGAGDPRNSGSMSTMFETFLQAYGWERGWDILTEMAGNVRNFDRFSSNTAKDVTLGETCYALAIDFYAFTQVAAAGRTNLTYVLPHDFAAVVPDGIALLKGAPNRVSAERFIDFVLSDEGQELWFLPKGYPGGPTQYSIERMSIRPEFYRRFRGISNIESSPFDLKQPFLYDGQLARKRSDIVSSLVGAFLVDTHPELKKAWAAMIRRGLLPAERKAFSQIPISAAEALQIVDGPWKDPAWRNKKKIEWQTWAQEKYRRLQ